MKETVSVVIVDDHEVVRVGLKALLADRPWVRVVAEAASAEAALEAVARHRPDIVILDIRLPGRSGIEACREIHARWPHTRVIMLTSYGDEALVRRAMVAGACTYVLKKVGNRQLLRLLGAVRRGEMLPDPAQAEQVMTRVQQQEQEEKEAYFQDLTTRELEVLAEVAQGRSNSEIAHTLDISYKTTRNYVSSIMGKLGCNSRVEAINYARQHVIERYL